MSTKTQAQRINELEAQVAALLARISMLEARAPVVVLPPAYQNPNYWHPSPTIGPLWCSGTSSPAQLS